MTLYICSDCGYKIGSNPVSCSNSTCIAYGRCGACYKAYLARDGNGAQGVVHGRRRNDGGGTYNTYIAAQVATGGYNDPGSWSLAETRLAGICLAMGQGLVHLTGYRTKGDKQLPFVHSVEKKC